MYLWALFGHDALAPVLQCGATRDAGVAMRFAEQQLIAGRAFVATMEEVRLRTSVSGETDSYEPTGRGWNGRRTTSGGVRWQAVSRWSEAGAIYRISDLDWRETITDSLAGGEAEPAAGPPPGHARR